MLAEVLGDDGADAGVVVAEDDGAVAAGWRERESGAGGVGGAGWCGGA